MSTFQAVRFTDKETGRKFVSAQEIKRGTCIGCDLDVTFHPDDGRICYRVVGYACLNQRVIIREIK